MKHLTNRDINRVREEVGDTKAERLNSLLREQADTSTVLSPEHLNEVNEILADARLVSSR